MITRSVHVGLGFNASQEDGKARGSKKTRTDKATTVPKPQTATVTKDKLSSLSSELLRMIFAFVPVDIALSSKVCKRIEAHVSLRKSTSETLWKTVVERDYSVTPEILKKFGLTSYRKAFELFSSKAFKEFFEVQQAVETDTALYYPLNHKPDFMRFWSTELCYSRRRTFVRLMEEPFQESPSIKTYITEENLQPSRIVCLDICQDIIAHGLADQSVWVQTASSEFTFMSMGEAPITAIKLEGDYVAIGHQNGKVATYNYTLKSALLPFTQHTSPISCLHFALNHIFSGSKTDGVYSYDFKKKITHLPLPETEVAREVTCIKLTSHTQPKVCSATSNGSVFIHNLDGKLESVLPNAPLLGHSLVAYPKHINAMAIQGDVIAAVSSHYLPTIEAARHFLSGTILFWDIYSKKLIGQFPITNECFDIKWEGYNLFMAHYGEDSQDSEGYRRVGMFLNRHNLTPIMQSLVLSQSQSQEKV